MAKTVTLPPVRVEPEMLQDMVAISERTGLSVYELTRQAVAAMISSFKPAKQAPASSVAPDGGFVEER